MPNPRSLEMKLRKAAERQGYVLRGSRRRDPNALDYGWRVETPKGKVVVRGDLDEIEAWLYTPRNERVSTSSR